MSKEWAWSSSRPPRTGRCATPPLAHGASTPDTHPTAAIDLPDQPTRVYLFTGVVVYVGRRGGRRGGRGVLSPPPPRVDPGAAMLRATRPGGGRRIDLSSCRGAQAGCPRRKKGPGQLCSRWSASVKLRGALGRCCAEPHQNPYFYGNYHRRVLGCYASARTYLSLKVRICTSGSLVEL